MLANAAKSPAAVPAAERGVAAPGSGAGIAVVMGGAMRDDNHEVWQRIVDLAGGHGARFVVFTSASEQPAQSAAYIVANLQRHGAVAEFVPVAPLLAGSDYRLAARDPSLVAKVRAARGIYFGGGAQERHTLALLDESGAPTPILAAIWEVYRAGGVVAGSSAGAAIMSSTMFRDAPDVLAALKHGLTEGKGQEIDRGLGFVGERVVVDQHFLKRGRLGRLLPLMVQKGYTLGVGVDENTAAVFQQGSLEVIGGSGVLIADLAAATQATLAPALSLRNVRLSYLERGDHYDMQRRKATPATGKTKDSGSPRASSPAGSSPALEPFMPDVLGDTRIAHLMVALLDSGATQAIGLAFDPRASRQADLGFEFRLRRGVDTAAYRSRVSDVPRYTVLNVELDVTPVRMAAPLYTPLAPR
ncbi:MAG: cyanophycinase [Rhodoferax sp.]|nr:cyanophycinase [Rhodoferax sp.]